MAGHAAGVQGGDAGPEGERAVWARERREGSSLHVPHSPQAASRAPWPPDACAALPPLPCSSPSQLGAYLFGGFAFLAIFPVWAFTRVLRRVTGIKPGQQDRLSRLRGRYTAFAFSLVHGLHELLRPVLGCGTTMAAPPR